MIEIRYAQIRSLDLSNGEGVGVAIFVQGCHFHCLNCFNPETWDFSGGNEWTEETKEKFLELADRPYIKRISILGGEPLAEENLDGVLDLVNEFRLSCPQKSIWLYTGYDFIDILKDTAKIKDKASLIRFMILKNVDVLIDGKYIDSKKDITLKWKGSSNQHVIDIQQSLQKGEIVLWQT